MTLIKRKKLAQLLDRSEGGIRVQECKNTLPPGFPRAIKIGRLCRYDLGEVEAYVASLKDQRDVSGRG